MINLLKDDINGKTIYKVWRSVRNLPARVLCEAYTNCFYKVYEVTEPNEYNKVDVNIEIFGTEKSTGKINYVCSLSGYLDINYVANFEKNIFFLNADEANEQKEKIISEIEYDILKSVRKSKAYLEESKKIIIS